ncbi:MAG TPA: hypothetical protein VFZ01_07740 [Geminicoccaceae bacterium]
MLIMGLAGLGTSPSHPENLTVEQPSEVVPLAIRSLLLDVARSDQTVIAVGERGHILVSSDGGTSFQQVISPVRSTLTALAFDDAGAAYAVGHDGVILKSGDSGRSWSLVFSAPDEERPLLDVLPLDHDEIVAVGAYGWLLRSRDGGTSWSDDLIDPEEPHLNAVAQGADGVLLVAAEFGLAFRSGDGGRTFERLELPYDGSFFGVLPVGQSWLVFGLRGHIFLSGDDRGEWEPVEGGTEASLLAGLQLDDGRTVLAGLGGTLLVSGDRGRSFEVVQDPDRLGISGLAEVDDGALLLAGEGGLRRMDDVLDAATISSLPAPRAR